MRTRVVGTSLVIAALLFVQDAGAQGADAALATDLFNAGRDLMAAGNHAAACPKLAESARLDAKVGTLAKSGECEEKLGRLVNARARWLQAQNLARAQGDARLARVEAEFARVDKLVPKLNIVLQGAAAPDLSLKVDDLQLSAASIGVPVPVEPGRHVVVASAPGRAPWSTTVEAGTDGAAVTVTIPELPSRPEAAAPAPQTTSTPTPTPAPAPATPPEPAAAPAPGPEGSTNPLKVGGLVTAGIGVVALGVGGVFAAQAKSSYDDSLNGGCTKNECTAAGLSLRNDARSAGTLATVFVVAGGVLAAGGITMFLVAPSRERKAASLRLSPSASRHDATLSLQGAF